MPFEETKKLEGHEEQVFIKRILVSLSLAVVSWVLTPGLIYEQRIVLCITVLSVLLWATAAIPLYITSLLLPIWLTLFGLYLPIKILPLFFDPVIVLLLGGLLIARAMHNLKLDEKIAITLVSLATNTKNIVIFLMITTAFLSMWMSNTATTALMLPIGIVLLKKLKLETKIYAKVVVLGIAFAANIGGIATLVGSPPNALTAGFLKELTGNVITFGGWMMYALPLTILLLPICWNLLWYWFKPEFKEVQIKKEKFKIGGKERIFSLIFFLTIVAWLTTPLHGVSSSIIALGSAIILLLLRFIKKEDLSKISWSTLFLVGGGLILGHAIVESGLSKSFIQLLGNSLLTQPLWIIAYGLIAVAMFWGVFISNTAAAALIVPLIIPLSALLGVNPIIYAVSVGIAVSLTFIFPIDTPPLALAYATGYIKIKDMLKVGLVMTLISLILVGLFALFIW